ncbi:unnamed protein product [Closterium sp. NIES-54]
MLSTAQSLYDAVVARYSSPATAALSRLMLPYIFPDLAALHLPQWLTSLLTSALVTPATTLPFPVNKDHFLSLCPTELTVDLLEERLAAAEKSILAVGASRSDRRTPFFEGCSPVPLLPSVASAAAVDLVGTEEVGAADHFLSLDPTVLTIDLLEQHLLVAETSVVAVGAARGTPRTPFFEGCSPSPLAPCYACAAAVDVPSAEDVGAASASVKRRSSKGKGGGSGSGSGGGGSSGGGGGSGGGGSGGSGGGSGGFGGGGGGSGGSGGSGSSGSGGGRTGAQRGGSGGGQRQRQHRRSETLSPQQLREWFSWRGASGGSVSCPYVIRTGERAGQTCGKPHTQHRSFSRLNNAWRAEFGDEVERPHWAELLSAEGDCYRCVPPDPEAAALGASESSLLGTVPAETLHTFTLD